MTTPGTPVDQPHRDQIAEARPEALFVEAGAGTGKTTALVARIVTLIREGTQLASISQLAAITFTENAASDLRTKVRRGLEKAAAKASGDEQTRLRTALELLDEAAITTLHGFAQRLLADLPLEAGLPPGFAIEDDTTAGLARDRWWDRVVSESLDDPALAETWRTALTLGLRTDRLKTVAEAFAVSYDQLPEGPAVRTALPAWDLAPVVAELRSVVQRYAGRVHAGDKLAQHFVTVLEPALEDLAQESDDLGRAAVLNSLKLVGGGGNAGAWKQAGLSKPDVVQELKQVNALWCERIDAVRDAVLATLIEELRVAVLAEVQQRRSQGKLQFHDLLVLAVRLMRNETARSACSERWRVLLVDEFQDTDPLQAELVHLLAASGPAATWQKADVAAGRLFFVGDPKQSIYRFRRADVALYREVQDQPGKLCLQLVENFRSRPAVLSVVNAALSRLMAVEQQVPYTDLQPHLAPVQDDPGPDVLLLGGPGDEKVSIGALRPIEAAHVARTCSRARDEKWLVRERQAEPRPARFADITILVPTRTSLGALEDALQEANVPYRIESRSLIWETDAVRDLLTLLEAIDDPGDDVAVVATLRHAGFACSDDDLLAWKARDGSWRLWATPPEGLEKSPVALGLTALRRYHDLRWWLPVNELLDHVVRERQLVELTAALPRPHDHWRRIRFVVDQARAFCDAGGDGVGEFVRWARQQAERQADAVESPVPEPDDDAVRIMTIHASKGLEFPIVVLTGLNAGPRAAGEVVWADGRPHVKLGEFMTPGCEDARKADGLLAKTEAVRVLYVGATRAVDHLVISLHHKQTTKPDNHAANLHVLLPQLLAAGAVHEFEPAALLDSTSTIHRTPFDAAGHEAFLQAREALLAEIQTRLPVTPSGLAVAAQAHSTQEPAEPPADGPGHRHSRARTGATLGSLVHRALELLDLTTPDVTDAVATAAAELGAPQLIGPAIQRVHVALASPLLQEAARGRHWKEVPVVATVRGRLLEGVVDLVLERGEGLVVVDYKTDAVPDEAALDAKVAAYAPQLGAYVDAVRVATGLPVLEAVLLFVGAAQTKERSVAAALA